MGIVFHPEILMRRPLIYILNHNANQCALSNESWYLIPNIIMICPSFSFWKPGENKIWHWDKNEFQIVLPVYLYSFPFIEKWRMLAKGFV